MKKEDKGFQEMTEKQRLYTQSRVQGHSPAESKRRAGYDNSTAVAHIERPGGLVNRTITKALDKVGATDRWLATNLKKGTEESWGNGFVRKGVDGEPEKVPNFRAHANYLEQIAKLRGYDRREPTVAVNINNQIAQLGRGVEQLDDRTVENLVRVIEGKIQETQSGGVHAGSSGAEDSTPHPRMDTIDTEAQSIGD